MLALTMVAAVLQVPMASPLPGPVAHADEPKAAATEQQAVAVAKQTGDPVEVISRRGESRTVRALPNGRIEVEQHVQPIRARQGGEWADIDTALHRSGDAIVPAATTVGLRFSTGGDDPMVQLTRAGRKLALTWPQPLPEPSLDGDTAVYKGVAGPDVDLRLRALSDGFAHVLAVKTAEAAKDPRVAKLVLGLSTSGLAVREDPQSGMVTATDTGSGAGMFAAPAPQMWDSSRAEPASAPARAAQDAGEPTEEPAMGAKTAPIEVTVADGKVTLTPDQALLTAPDTTFPVYLDPVYRTLKASSWGMVTSGWPDENYPMFNGKSTEGMGRCEVAKDPNCVKNQTKRLFYRLPLPSLKGRYIQSAEVIAYETSAYNCSNKTSVQLWRTNTLKSYATWNNTNSSSVWDAHLASRDVAFCSKAPVEFGGSTLRAHVQDAVNKGYGTITFGLKAYSESTMDWWKRFADDAYLKVQYNNPPKQPDTDTMFAKPGGSCASSGSAKWVNVVPTVFATLVDPDTEDKNKVQGQFTLHWANNPDGSDWGPKWTSGLVGPKTSGTQFQQELPPTIPKNTSIGWGVRVWDGAQWGPWSYDGAQTGCYFLFNPDLPAKPTITSTDYPADGPWTDGVGVPGTFTISDAAGLADRYVVWLNGVQYTTVTTSAGAARQVQITPTMSGPNHLTVEAFTPSSQDGSTFTYQFRVNTGKPPKARFSLDEPAGSTAVQAVTRDGDPAVSAATHGTVTFGTDGQDGDAIQLDGSTGYAATNGPVIDTTKSFAVSAWLKADGSVSSPTRNFTAVSARGESKSAFYLKYVEATGRWVFARTAVDGDDPGWFQAESKDPAQTDEWTHLVGVFDAVAKRLHIYVNGERGVDSPEVSSVWNASEGLEIGRSQWGGTPVDYWAGQIDDVRVYDRIVGQEEVNELVNQHPVLKARWKLNKAVDLSSPGEPSRTPPVPALTLSQGATIDPDAQFMWALGAGGLNLNATEHAYAQSQDWVIHTDESFTVAGWVRNVGRPQLPATVFSQAGANANVFTLRYVPGEDPELQGGWQAEMRNSDSSAGDPMVASHSAFPEGNWAHIAVVYDALRDRLSLYVNGELDETSAGVSQEDHVVGFPTENALLQVGRNKLGTGDATESWPDAIDDIWVYQGALTKDQIHILAGPTEITTEDGP
ncbi:LamG-like jellyroll fold domain-containing protein [Actinomadura darangshiensis]|uniref:LamG-like jellyroll fold domain-containing protein n=1 Tax=Actinomadura darangshiensis TaxID=705336 RepID=UPI00140C8F41|nr:LamG-like jellyroll fold domain-containing protein [Actinomadura darangshiensis]